MQENTKHIDLDAFERNIDSYPRETVNQLYDIGKLMVTEGQQRIRQTETKSGIYLAFGASIAAIIFSASGSVGSACVGILLAFAVASLLIALAFALAGALSRTYQFPSERDWVKRELLNTPDLLLEYHVISLLYWNRDSRPMGRRKATYVFVAEIALICSSTFLVLSSILRIAR